MIFLVVFVLLTLFFIFWLFWLHKPVQEVWKGSFNRFFTHLLTLVIICLLPVIVNLLDFVDWSGKGGNDRNLILVSIDTLRADHLGCYGYYKGVSPNIDAFASEGIRFSKAISQSSWTLPSHASLFTGVYPSAHGAVNKQRSIPLSFLMVGEILRNAGYSSAAFTGGGYLNPIYGFGQGFMEYRHCEALDSDDVWRFIDGVGGKPFFLFLHTYKVHNYYVPPDLAGMIHGEGKEDFQDLESIMSFVDRYRLEDLDEEARSVLEYLHDRYEVSILAIDRQFGSLVKGLRGRGLLKNTIIVFLSDHGEALGEHGRTYHGGTLYNEQPHVPLLMKIPDMPVGGRVCEGGVVRMDVFLTFRECLELLVLGCINAGSLVRRTGGRGESFDGLAFSEISSHVTEKYAVCSESLKLIYSPKTENLPLPGNGELETFEVSWGPGWRENPLALGEDNKLIDQFREWYERMYREREAGSPGGEVAIDPVLREELKALGYVR